MATTTNGIVYPDDYTAVADIPADLQTMAESIETAIETAIANSLGDIETILTELDVGGGVE